MITTDASVMDDNIIVTATDIIITDDLETNQKSFCACPAMETCGMGSEKSEVKVRVFSNNNIIISVDIKSIKFNVL